MQFGFKRDILANLPENPLPPYFIIKAKAEPNSIWDNTRSLVSKLKTLNEIEKIDFGEQIFYKLERYERFATSFILICCTIFALSLLFIFFNTFELMFRNKQEDLKTLNLLGLTPFQTKLPFVVECTLLTFAGAVISMITIWGIYNLLMSNLAKSFLGIEVPVKIMFLTLDQILMFIFLIPFAGFLISLCTIKMTK
jgi:cell division protein FtsX